MSEIMKISKVMEISVLGYNFASFIKDFKKAYIQPDGTYDYMSYIAIVDPASYFMLANNLGSVDIANNYLNAMLTQTINNISVVNGGKKMKGGVNFISTIFTIGLLFLTGIQSSLAAETSHEAQRELDDFYRIKGLTGPMSEPQTIEGWFWNTKPTKQQLALFAQQEQLRLAAGKESDVNEDIKREEEGERQTTLETVRIQAGKEVDLAKIPGNVVADAIKDAYTDAFEKISANSEELNNFKMGTILAVGGGALGWYILQKNAKKMLIADVIVRSLPDLIEIGQRVGKVIVVNGEYFTTDEYMNFLNIALNNKRNRPGQFQQVPSQNYDQFADRSGIDNSRRTTQNADRLGIEDSRGANQNADRFGIENSRGGKYRKTRKSRKSRKIRKH